MRVSRFFVPLSLTLGRHVLPEAQSHYIGRVLRLAKGDAVQLFDGSGQEFAGSLLEVGKKSVTVELDDQWEGQSPSSLAIHLGQGLSRGERMDWAIQKATELGAAQITPLFTERCEVRLNDERSDKRMAHWQQIIISACEQCGRSVLPVLNPPRQLADWLTSLDDPLRLVLHPDSPAALQQHPRPESLALLIGPEGGLSESEVQLARQHAFHATRLGPRVLRTETAPVVALSVAQLLWGDFQ